MYPCENRRAGISWHGVQWWSLHHRRRYHPSASRKGVDENLASQVKKPRSSYGRSLRTHWQETSCPCRQWAWVCWIAAHLAVTRIGSAPAGCSLAASRRTALRASARSLHSCHLLLESLRRDAATAWPRVEDLLFEPTILWVIYTEDPSTPEPPYLHVTLIICFSWGLYCMIELWHQNGTPLAETVPTENQCLAASLSSTSLRCVNLNVW